MFLLKGWASTPSIDDEACLFAHGSIRWHEKALPRLLVSHRDGELGRPLEIAGRILSLEWKPHGLWTEVVVEDKYQAAKAFSVGASMRDGAFEIIGNGKAAYAKVTRVRMTELSITDNPANRNAVVTQREHRVETPMTKDADWMREFNERRAQRAVELNLLLAEMRAGR